MKAETLESLVGYLTGEGREEKVAAELHDLYLRTAKRHGWALPDSVNVAYDELPEGAKELDRAVARWHMRRQIQLIEALTKMMTEVIGVGRLLNLVDDD